jgi:Tol biopolymer transport system component
MLRRTAAASMVAAVVGAPLTAQVVGQAPALAAPGQTSRVSTSSAGAQANNHSFSQDISADGRYVVYSSSATNLVPGDTNGQSDIFVKDRRTGANIRVNVRTVGQAQLQCTGATSFDPHISGTGRFVIYESQCGDLVAGDTNGLDDIFVYDRDVDNDGVFDEAGGTLTTRVSLTRSGAQIGNGAFDANISDDGSAVAFVSRADLGFGANGQDQLYWRFRSSPGSLNIVSHSFLTRCIPGQACLLGNQTRARKPTLSRDGRFVAYDADGSNLVSGDVNGFTDVFRWDRFARDNLLVSRASGVLGAQGDGGSSRASISGDGNLIAFTSLATNLGDNEVGESAFAPDIFLRNVASATTISLSKAGGLIGLSDLNEVPVINDRGTTVAFTSERLGFPQPPSRILVRDLPGGPVQQADVTSVPPGTPSNGSSFQPALTADGRQVSFSSGGTNLVLGDGNGKIDAFVHER